MTRMTVCLLSLLVFTIDCANAADSTGNPSPMLIKQKANQVRNTLIQKKRSGEDVSKLLQMMARVKIKADSGNLKEAEAILDHILAITFNDTQYKAGRTKSEIKPHVSGGESHYLKLTIRNDKSKSGIFDPSIEYGNSNKTGWLAYSSIRGSSDCEGSCISTHLAKSVNQGETWEFVKIVNKSFNGTLKKSDGTEMEGIWRYEVPTLVFDPDAPDSGERWKLYAHRYFWSKKTGRNPKYGWITYRYANKPDGKWSEEIALFRAGKFPPAPYTAQINVNSLHSSLKKVVAYTEPAAYYKNGRLYMAMTGHGTKKPRVILLASSDHGDTWEYISELLTSRDARQFGYEWFDGASIADMDGKVFLLISPGGKKLHHDGTMVMEFENLEAGSLKLDDSDKPVVIVRVQPDKALLGNGNDGPEWLKIGAGPSDYDKFNQAGGIIMPQMNNKGAEDIFQMFNTKKHITNPSGS